MVFLQNANHLDARPARQFSLRDLLQLTLIVSVLLTIGFVARGTERFQAFSTAWTAVSMLPVVGVLVAYCWRLVSRRKLVAASVLGYVAALCLPSIGGGDDIEFGVQAAIMSFAGLQYWWDPYIHSNILIGSASVPVPFFTVTIGLSLTVACTLGAAANLVYWIGVVSCWLGRKRLRASRIASRGAALATFLAISSIIVMCLDSDTDTFYPGCGLWIASFLALALGAR